MNYSLKVMCRKVGLHLTEEPQLKETCLNNRANLFMKF